MGILMNIAIASKNIEVSQLLFLINNQKNNFNISLYSINRLKKLYSYNMSVLPISELNYFIGDFIIATDIDSCRFALNMANNKRVIFYSFDLDWIRSKNIKYNDYAEIYQNKKLKLFCRTKYHSDIIKSSWNCDCSHIDDFCLKEMVEQYEKR